MAEPSDESSSREGDAPRRRYDPPAVAWEQPFDVGELTSACAKLASDGLCSASASS